MSLPNLPTELLLLIVSGLTSLKDINALVQTCRRCYATLDAYLYKHALKVETQTRIELAAENARPDSFERAMKFESESGLMWAATKGLVGTVEKFIHVGPIPLSMRKMGPNDISFFASFCVHPLCAAAHSGHYDVVAHLLQRGVTANADVKAYCQAAVVHAAKGDHVDIFKLLVSKGVDLEFAYNYISKPRGWGERGFRDRSDAEEDPYRDHNRLLHFAARSNASLVLKFLLDRGIDMYCLGRFGDSALHHASLRGAEKTVRLLLARGFDPNSISENDNRPLHRAGVWPTASDAQGGGGVARALLEYGADPYLANADGLRPMYIAVLLDQDDNLAALLDHGVRPDALDRDGNLPPFESTEESPQVHVRYILKWSAEPHTYLSFEGLTCNSLLYLAAINNCLRVARRLLDHGVDPSPPNEKSELPLHIAVRTRHSAMVSLLAEGGANLEAVDLGGKTALDWAMSKCSSDLVERLVSCGGSLVFQKQLDRHFLQALLCKHESDTDPVPNRIVEFPRDLQRCIKWKYPQKHKDPSCGKFVKLFLDRGCKAESRDFLGRTLLHQATYKRCAAAIEVLITNRADPNAADVFGQTPLHLVLCGDSEPYHSGFEDEPGIKALLAAGADPGKRDVNGATPLHMAVRAGLSGMVRILIESNADLEIQDNGGNTVLHVAFKTQFQSLAIIEILLQAGADAYTPDDYGYSPMFYTLGRTPDDQARLDTLLFKFGHII